MLWSENLKDVLAKTVGGEKEGGGKMFLDPGLFCMGHDDTYGGS